MGEYVGALVVMVIVAVAGVAIATSEGWEEFGTAFTDFATTLIGDPTNPDVGGGAAGAGAAD